MSKRILSAIALLVIVAAPAAAQERSRAVAPRGDPAPARVRVASTARSAELATVERVLRMRERLELTDEQVSQFEGIRREALERWIGSALEQEELQSRLRAGYEDDDAAERLRALAEARRGDAEQTRERVQSLLSDEQRQQFQRGSRAAVAPRGELRRVPAARARVRVPGVAPVPEARRVPQAGVMPRGTPAPGMRRAPRAPEAPRVRPAPRPPRPTPAPRVRLRRWM